MAGKKWVSTLVIIASVLLCDYLSKAYVHTHIPLLFLSSPFFPYDGIPIFKDLFGVDFCITHVHNKGAAWGFFASWHQVLFYFRLIVIGGLITYLFFTKTAPVRQFALALIAGGAIGNVLDSFLYGHVIDMFYMIFWGYSYPVFNIADSAIFCGIATILLQNLFNSLKSKKPQPTRR